MQSKLLVSVCASVLALGVYGTVSAKPRISPIEISISYSDKLEKEFVENYGIREKKSIEETIRKELSDELGADITRAEVTVIDVKPNRPTFEQMGNKPGLSMQSFSIGGAELSGKTFDRDGKVISVVNYEYTSPSIFDARMNHTWNDADYAIYRFARRLASN